MPIKADVKSEAILRLRCKLEVYEEIQMMLDKA